jgi:hypothetical protein
MKLFHCKYSFITMNMLVITSQDLDLYPIMDHRQMKALVEISQNVTIPFTTTCDL